MNRFRLAAFAASALVLALAMPAREARAAADVHNFNIVFSAIPSSIEGGGFNEVIDQYNQIVLEPRDYNSIEEISFGWMFDAELRYFVRQNVALTLGVGQMKTQSKREFLPLINQSIDVRAEIITVPVHAGADYYFAPYNQGDFQARAYVGAGVLSNVFSRATFEQVETGTTPATSLGGSFTARATRDSPGYYMQTGVHMFFASSWSVLVGAVFRSAKIEMILDQETYAPATDLLGNPISLDVSGFGARLGVAKGF